jgi:hypothetical protein
MTDGIDTIQAERPAIESLPSHASRYGDQWHARLQVLEKKRSFHV